MTGFDRDFVERLESIIGWKPISDAPSIEDAIFNELKRLQARVQELEEALSEISCRSTGTVCKIACDVFNKDGDA